VVASATVKGTLRNRARDWASRVLPVPVGPISRMFDFWISTPSVLLPQVDALVVVVDRDREDLLGPVLADDVVRRGTP
jgi:hypothetical protein